MTDHTDSPPAPPPARPTTPIRRWRVAVVAAACLVAGTALAAGLLRREAPPPAPEPPDLAREAEADLARRNYKPLSDPLAALLADPAYKPVPTQAHPLLGRPAPDFALPDTDGKAVSLSEARKAGPVVLVFYYGYQCDHCVSQLFALHKDIDKFRELGATVLALSADPGDQTRERFKRYGAFAFPVLSDPANAVATKYGTYAPNPKAGEDGDLLHGTFVIDREGRVAWANRGDGPFTENRTLLVELHRGRR